MKIYVNYKPKNTRDLLQWFFKPLPFDLMGRGKITYFDEKCTVIQCKDGKYRSYDDIYSMCKTYFPGISTRSLTHYLLTLDIKATMYDREKVLVPFLHTCADMRRIRCMYYHGYSYEEIECFQFDSQWSWAYLLKEVGINTREELLNYISIEKKKVLERTLV